MSRTLPLDAGRSNQGLRHGVINSKVVKLSWHVSNTVLQRKDINDTSERKHQNDPRRYDDFGTTRVGGCDG